MSGHAEVIGQVEDLSEEKSWMVNPCPFRNYKIHVSTTTMDVLSTGGGRYQISYFSHIGKFIPQTGFVPSQFFTYKSASNMLEICSLEPTWYLFLL